MKLLVATAVALAIAGVAMAASAREPKRVILPAVQAKARAINVRLTDLPRGGWTVKPPSSGEGSPRCSYYDPDQSDLTENGKANSPQFARANGSIVSSTTAIFKSATQGRTGYARVVQPKLPRCLAEIFRKDSGQPSNVKIILASTRSFPPLAERTNAYRVAADFRTSSGTIRVYLDVVLMNRGKVDIVVFFVGIGKPFANSFEQGVAAKIAARAAAA